MLFVMYACKRIVRAIFLSLCRVVSFLPSPPDVSNAVARRVRTVVLVAELIHMA